MMRPPPTPSSYEDILKRMTQHMRQNKVDDQILEILRQAFERELNQESAVLSRPERNRLFHEVTEALFNDVLGKMGGSKE